MTTAATIPGSSHKTFRNKPWIEWKNFFLACLLYLWRKGVINLSTEYSLGSRWLLCYPSRELNNITPLWHALSHIYRVGRANKRLSHCYFWKIAENIFGKPSLKWLSNATPHLSCHSVQILTSSASKGRHSTEQWHLGSRKSLWVQIATRTRTAQGGSQAWVHDLSF